MPSWTKEQELAISKSGCNIIVSAGAGSGKTAVLTERVIRKLQNGGDISRLLILTFTNAAAKEMKERIRNALKKANLKEELAKIDASYITTFDSFALSIVKKYHYLLNINQDIEIANDLILKWKKEELLKSIFDELYERENPLFLKLIKDFSIRDDTNMQDSILEINDKLDLMYEKREYLTSYFNTYYSDSYIAKRIFEYEQIIFKKIQKIKDNLENLEILDEDFSTSMYEVLRNLLNSKTYLEIKNSIDIKLPRLKKGMDDLKPYKEKISNLLKDILKLTIYENEEEIKTAIIKTKDYVEIIIYIILKLDTKFSKFKQKNDLYDFTDISKLAIKIVLENESVASELKNSFDEILVDEYQDTSDLQELFISLIAKNNVYMVGDIKQSIYRFRNANPNLFKEKYEAYQNNQGGFKIDLVKNFRSREETLANINYIFNYIMDLEIGGADYKNYHQMIFGNTTYDDFKQKTQDYNFNIYNYTLEDNIYSKDEVEAFITASDILTKVNSNYQVYDKNINALRNITYDDFVILIDKSTSFELYKKIFEYKGIPLTILKDEVISGSYDLFILKNILILLKSLKEKKYDNTFKYAYLSVGRSYLFRISDDTLYKTLKNNTYLETEIMEKVNNLLPYLDTIPINLLINKIVSEFSFYEALITVGNINESIIRLDYLEDLSLNLSKLGYTYLDLIEYFNKMSETNADIKYSLNKDIKNSVKIMTIHKSKGLEYHICYYTGLTNKFNFQDAKKRFVFDKSYGIITPIINGGVQNTIYHTLYKDNYIKEDVSERIRLFYVALTRAKEKMILITSLKDESEEDLEMVNIDTRLKYTSFASILNSISDKLEPYITNIDLNKYELTKDYNLFKANNIFEKIPKTTETIAVVEFPNKSELIKTEKFSKSNSQLLTKDDKEKLEFGTFLHYLLEVIDLKKPDLTIIPKKYQKYLKNFLKSPLLTNVLEANIYKEYEFIYVADFKKSHGIIDLMLEYSDYIDIIDYKLKNVADLEYVKQLKGYQEYISKKTKKKVNLYLYSIIDANYKKIE